MTIKNVELHAKTVPEDLWYQGEWKGMARPKMTCDKNLD
jgi:hypothetical protein